MLRPSQVLQSNCWKPDKRKLYKSTPERGRAGALVDLKAKFESLERF